MTGVGSSATASPRWKQLETLLPLTPEEREGVALAGNNLAMAITPYFFNLIDRDDPELSDPPSGHSARRGNDDGAVGDDRPVRRGRAHARAGVGAPVSGPGAVSGDRPVRGLLPVLHAAPGGQRGGEQHLQTEFERGDQLHPRSTPRSATCC